MAIFFTPRQIKENKIAKRKNPCTKEAMMKKLCLILFVCVGIVYADSVLDSNSNRECLGIDFRSSNPLRKLDSRFGFYARGRMVDTAKKFGVGFCLDYYGLSQKIEIMEMQWFDAFFEKIERVGNADSGRCFTTNKRKQLKEEIKAYVI